MDTFEKNQHLFRSELDKLTASEVEVFDALKFCAVYVAGCNARIPREFGIADTVGVLPIFPGRTSSRKDNISPTIDRFSALFPQGVKFRIWCDSQEAAKRFEMEIPASLSRLTRKLRGGWYDLLPGTDFMGLQIVLQDLARDLGIQTYDDLQLKHYIAELLKSKETVASSVSK